MSILSRSKASLRGSQPFPDPAFSFQPHASFPLSFAAATFWCLWVLVGFFFSMFPALFQWSSRRWSTWCDAAEGRPWETRGRAGKDAAEAIFQMDSGARTGVPAAATKPKWPWGRYLQSQAGEQLSGCCWHCLGQGWELTPHQNHRKFWVEGTFKGSCSDQGAQSLIQADSSGMGHLPPPWATCDVGWAFGSWSQLEQSSSQFLDLCWAGAAAMSCLVNHTDFLFSTAVSFPQSSSAVSAGIEENEWRFQGISECFSLPGNPAWPGSALGSNEIKCFPNLFTLNVSWILATME